MDPNAEGGPPKAEIEIAEVEVDVVPPPSSKPEIDINAPKAAPAKPVVDPEVQAAIKVSASIPRVADHRNDSAPPSLTSRLHLRAASSAQRVSPAGTARPRVS